MNHPTDRISLWPWGDAPEELKKYSPHGGDEDFVAFIPTELVDTYTVKDQLKRMANDYSSCQVDGGEVIIGAHA